jgi:peptide/nickel transport system substrate-binding protein/oligopeptide transport system substrate-binding protein
MIGRVLGDYRIERLLNTGGTGAVFLGQRVEPPQEKVAVKILVLPWQASAADRASFYLRFQREAETLKSLQHPHILSLVAFGEDNGAPYMVLPYMEGGNLADVLARQEGQMPFSHVATYLDQLASALDYAHAQGVVHRDIKPANVLLDTQGQVFLSDFSVARLLDTTRTALTATGLVVGTPEYLAPEQANGEHVGPAADVYSLGVLAYHLVAGRPPFQGNSIAELIKKQTQDMPPSLRLFRPDLPPPAEAAILRALAKRPMDRYENAAEFAATFGQGLQGIGPGSIPPGAFSGQATGMFVPGQTVSATHPNNVGHAQTLPPQGVSPTVATPQPGFNPSQQIPYTPVPGPHAPAAGYGMPGYPGYPGYNPMPGYAPQPVYNPGQPYPAGASPYGTPAPGTPTPYPVATPSAMAEPKRRGRAWISTIAAVLVVAVLAGLLVAKLPHGGGPGGVFGGGSGTPAPAKATDQTLKMLWNSGGSTNDIDSLDPGQVVYTVDVPIVNLIFDGLVTLDKNLNVEPWGAARWDVSADGLTYTFHLRPNQKFSDGAPVKASDYAYSINRTANPCFGSQLAYYLTLLRDAATFSNETCSGGQINGAFQTLIGDSVIPDDSANTLALRLAAPAGYFLEDLSSPASYTVEKTAVTGANLGKDGAWLGGLAQGATGRGGSGMFYVSRWDHAGNLILKANPNWWGVSAGKKPSFTEIDFKFFSDNSARYSAYEGDSTYAFSDTIPVDQAASAKSQADYHEVPELAVVGLEFNWKIAPFDNLDARQAFCLALNRDQLTATISHGTMIPSWHIVPKGMSGFNDNLRGIDGAPTSGDLAKAQQHWNAYKATLNGAPVPPIKLSFNLSSASQQATAEAYQAMWNQALGINTQIDQTPWSTILRNETLKTVQIYRFGWVADYPDPQDFLTTLLSTDSPYNWSNAGVPQADTLMKQADEMRDINQRLPLYNQAEQLLIDNVAFCPLSQPKNQYRLRSWVAGGFTQDAQGLFPNDAWVSGYIAKH